MERDEQGKGVAGNEENGARAMERRPALPRNTLSADLRRDGQLAEDQLVCAGCYPDSIIESYWSDFFWLGD